MNFAAPIASQEPGANNPPDETNVLYERLREANEDLLRRADDLLAGAARVPDVTDDTMAGKVGDFVKQLTGFNKLADQKRVAEKEPFLSAGRTVDGFFKAMTDRVDTAKKGVERKLSVYLHAKAAEEKRIREEAAAAAREAARIAAEAAARAEAAIRAERDAASALAAQADMAAAIAAEEAAKVAKADSEKRQREADAKLAEMSRTRGDYGAVATLRTVWTFRDLNRDTLDLECLRHHLPMDGLEKAVRSAIKAGAREITGVVIFEDSNAVVR